MARATARAVAVALAAWPIIGWAPVLAAGPAAAPAATPAADTTTPPRSWPTGECPSAQAPVLEGFMPADCPQCWAARQPVPGAAWRLDWITPAAPEAVDAAMADAALREAAEREQRADRAGRGKGQHWSANPPAADPGWARTAAGLAVVSGPGWAGYLGAQITFTLPPTLGHGPAPGWPAGSRFWVGLVEAVPADSAGNPEARVLVRGVAGPWAVPAEMVAQAKTAAAAVHGPATKPLRWRHWMALRMPEAARSERLQLRAWVETRPGQIIAMAADRCL